MNSSPPVELGETHNLRVGMAQAKGTTGTTSLVNLNVRTVTGTYRGPRKAALVSPRVLAGERTHSSNEDNPNNTVQ